MATNVKIDSWKSGGATFPFARYTSSKQSTLKVNYKIKKVLHPKVVRLLIFAIKKKKGERRLQDSSPSTESGKKLVHSRRLLKQA